MEKGHYGGRTQPTDTRQGTYMLTAAGEFLASVNTNSPEQMALTMREALRKWEVLESDRRIPGQPINPATIDRFERKFPFDGLAVRVLVRDLPRSERPSDWRADAWNRDYAWFSADEVRGMIPPAKIGAEAATPAEAIKRLARLHFVDTARGQSPPFQPQAIEKASLTARVVAIAGEIATLRLEGLVRSVEKGRWSVAGFRDMQAPAERERGIELKLLGRATARGKRFLTFEIVAIGVRWGATQYNGRADDQGVSPIGFLLTRIEGRPEERIAPANWWAYGW